MGSNIARFIQVFRQNKTSDKPHDLALAYTFAKADDYESIRLSGGFGTPLKVSTHHEVRKSREILEPDAESDQAWLIACLVPPRSVTTGNGKDDITMEALMATSLTEAQVNTHVVDTAVLPLCQFVVTDKPKDPAARMLLWDALTICLTDFFLALTSNR